jgi:hypothetical protein
MTIQSDYRETEMRRLREKNALLMIIIAVIHWFSSMRDKEQQCISKLNGAEYTRELFEGSDSRFIAMVRMSKVAMRTLCAELREADVIRDTRTITVEEMMCITMKILGQNCSVRSCADRFQHSTSTISDVFEKSLIAIMTLKDSFIKLPDDRIAEGIYDDPRMWPYFRDCLGALDGSHILLEVDAEMTVRCRNRKGLISQNVLAACDFDLTFQYVLAGWEGSAHDGRVFRDARSKDFVIPDGKYFLGDAGYGLSKKVLTPYRGVRYHLKEQHRAGRAPETKEELFNLRHAQLRNAIERIFGVLKNRFRILRSASQYSYDKVTLIVYVCVILHNISGVFWVSMVMVR